MTTSELSRVSESVPGTVVFRDLLSEANLAGLDWQTWLQPDRKGAEVFALFPEPPSTSSAASPPSPPSSGVAAFLTRLAPGAHGDLHEHLGHELMFVLAGELIEDDGSRYGVGDVVVKAPGSVHRVMTDAGCTVLGVRAAPTRPAGAEETAATEGAPAAGRPDGRRRRR
ncbi:ChrR Cupin-like domain-containing protein [Parafrankia irregularis]|uniref:ChrR Cupin-like domain-containing protein n=1 Tax=Parafrankia irregularis TaxID=795642 RepID=A0A0S4QIK8_9ACTN|nr:ChrR Cupin-like domain-containing protein [Parafrankia irregularis]